VAFVVIFLLGLAGWFWQKFEREREGRQSADRLTDEQRKHAAAEKAAAHAARVTAAREMARRGDWPSAMTEYDRVIGEGGEDVPRLRVERLVGYFALNRCDELVAELDALDATDLGELGAQVKLMRGAWLLCDTAGQPEGRALVRQALEQRQHLFSEADVAFAEGLAAEQVGKSLQSFRAAAKADPLHYLAGASLAVALTAVGEREAALRQAQFLRGVFTASPLPDAMEANLAALDGDRDGVKTALRRMASKSPTDQQAAIDRTEKNLIMLIDLMECCNRIGAARGLPAFTEGVRLTTLAGKVAAAISRPDGLPRLLPVPGVTLMYRRVFDVLRAYGEVAQDAMAGRVNPATLSRLQALIDDYPNAELLALSAVSHVWMAIGPLDRGELATARRHFAEGADLAARAVRTAGLLPHSNVPYLARTTAVAADVAILRLTPRPDPDHLRRVREFLHPVVSEGAKWKNLRQETIPLIVRLTAVPLTAAQSADWNLADPAGRAAYDRRRRDLAALARALLDDWSIDEPNNPQLPMLRKLLEDSAASTGVVETAPPPTKADALRPRGGRD
jgi:hypothetical protein